MGLVWTLLGVGSLIGVIMSLLCVLGPRTGGFFFKCRYAVYVYLVSIMAIICMPMFLIHPKDVQHCLSMSFILRHITKIVGITWEIRGAEHLKAPPKEVGTYDDGAVIVVNHQSGFDILGLFNIWEHLGRCTCIAKSELFWVWPFGLGAWLAGVVFIKRSDPKDCVRQLQETANEMKQKNTKILVFPEGTRNNGSAPLLSFKKGAFRTAVVAKCPIIPLVISPYYYIKPEDQYFGKGHMIIQALPPISTAECTIADVDKLMVDTRESMVEVYNKLYKESTGEDFVPKANRIPAEAKKAC